MKNKKKNKKEELSDETLNSLDGFTRDTYYQDFPYADDPYDLATGVLRGRVKVDLS